MKKTNNTLEEVIIKEFGEIVPLKFKPVDVPIWTLDRIVEEFGGFWEKFVFQTSLVNFRKLKDWALNSTFKKLLDL